jgi:plastocyanin
MFRQNRLVIPVAVALLALAVVAGIGCSKSSPTQPGGGGGGTEPFNSGNFSSGSFVHTFNTAGDFAYHCQIHGTAMSGSVHVGTGFADSAVANIQNNFYTPNPVNVNPGGYVRWVANGTAHSVTR